ncbi:hypothetical protein GY45DRAFT_1142690 [Cubamyces sp. BRFM 1775]|nr:hypothetical protein GY45DRAFT_1142690 [Cubamyces sp. BRFM 1775]
MLASLPTHSDGAHNPARVSRMNITALRARGTQRSFRRPHIPSLRRALEKAPRLTRPCATSCTAYIAYSEHAGSRISRSIESRVAGAPTAFKESAASVRHGVHMLLYVLHKRSRRTRTSVRRGMRNVSMIDPSGKNARSRTTPSLRARTFAMSVVLCLVRARRREVASYAVASKLPMASESNAIHPFLVAPPGHTTSTCRLPAYAIIFEHNPANFEIPPRVQ